MFRNLVDHPWILVVLSLLVMAVVVAVVVGVVVVRALTKRRPPGPGTGG